MVRWGSGRNTVREYMVLRATFGTGEQLVIDPTHAQWGWGECVYDWETYVEHRARAVIAIRPFGHWGGVAGPARGLRPAPNSYDFNMILLRKEVMTAAVEKLRDLIAPYKEWKNLVDLPLEHWREAIKRMRAEVEHAIVRAQTTDRAAGVGRVFFDEGENFWRPGVDDDELCKAARWKLNVTGSRSAEARYDRVWLNVNEIAACGYNPDAMKRLWAKKMREAQQTLDLDFQTSFVFSGPSRLLR